MYNLTISKAALFFADKFLSKDVYASKCLTELCAVKRREGVMLIGCNGHTMGVFMDKSATMDTEYASFCLPQKDVSTYRPTKKSLGDKADVTYSDNARPSVHEVYTDLAECYADSENLSYAAVDVSPEVLMPFVFNGVEGGKNIRIIGRRIWAKIPDIATTIYLVSKSTTFPFEFFGFFMPSSHEKIVACLPNWA